MRIAKDIYHVIVFWLSLAALCSICQIIERVGSLIIRFIP